MTEKAIKDLGDKVSESDKKEAQELIDNTKKALEKDNVEDIKNAKDKLLEKANALASKVYEEAAKNNQSSSDTSADDNTSSDNKDDNVVDADYEEK